jgi:hypothetical protein
VGGGRRNRASTQYTTVAGGDSNTASGWYGTVGGGWGNRASTISTVSGGAYNIASGDRSTVGGGNQNDATGENSFVGGGRYNSASALSATVAGGYSNDATEIYATVSGGRDNIANIRATVGGGTDNAATGGYSTVGGGYADTSAAGYSFTVGNNSVVPTVYSNSAAFNGQTATAGSQTRVGILSKSSGSFTIDHPLEPMQRILNHYFVESPEMVLIYRGVARMGADGRAVVHLPDYFDALNRNPMIQLTGVGTYEVFVAERVKGNRFVIGGKPGAEVYWTVTGDRKDQSAEITRIIMPVEQGKDGDLEGRSLDDDFLATTKAQLEQMGQGSQFRFRTTRGRQKYEQSQRALLENK